MLRPRNSLRPRSGLKGELNQLADALAKVLAAWWLQHQADNKKTVALREATAQEVPDESRQPSG
jgi:hypothetical protein